MVFALLVILAVVVVVFVLAGAIAAISRLLTKSDAMALALGTLTIPALICGSFVYWLKTMEVDDAPPGMVLFGNLIAVAVAAPIALLASYLALRLLSRRRSRNGG